MIHRHSSLTTPLLTALTLAAIGLAAPLCTHADSAGAVRAIIQKAYNQQDAALAHLDANGTTSGYAPDFVGSEKAGQHVTLAQVRMTASLMFAHMRAASGKTTIMTFQTAGSVAHVRVRAHDVLTVIPPGSEKTGKIIANEVSQDTWKKHGKRWLLESSQIISDSTTLNGKPLPE
jgi:hypothetical protein